MTSAVATTVRLTDGVLAAAAGTVTLANVVPAAADVLAARQRPAWQVAEHLAARTLLRGLLAEVAAADEPIAARSTGQPYLPGRPDLAISLSHEAGHVAAALGVGIAIGIDVQVPVPVSSALLRRCCCPAVRAELEALPEATRDLEFAWIWTVQEACVKATGAGLTDRPWAIPVDRGQHEGEWRGHRWVSLRDNSAVPVSVAYRQGRPGGSHDHA